MLFLLCSGEPWQGRQAHYHCTALPTHTLVFLQSTIGGSPKLSVTVLGPLKLCVVVPWIVSMLGRTFKDNVGAGVEEEPKEHTWRLTYPTLVTELSSVPSFDVGEQPAILNSHELVSLL